MSSPSSAPMLTVGVGATAHDAERFTTSFSAIAIPALSRTVMPAVLASPGEQPVIQRAVSRALQAVGETRRDMGASAGGEVERGRCTVRGAPASAAPLHAAHLVGSGGRY